MSYESTVTQRTYTNKFLPYWFIPVFTIGIILTCVLFFPIKTIQSEVLKATAPEPLTLYYLKQLTSMYPAKNQLRISLAWQLIEFYEWKDAEQQIQILEKIPTLKVESKLLRFQAAETKAFLIPAGKKRNAALQSLKKDILTFDTLPLSSTQIMQLASIALSMEMPSTALDFYEKLGKITDPKLLKKIANTAMQVSQYGVAANYYMRAFKYEHTDEYRRDDVIATLNAYQAGSLFPEGISLITNLPDKIIHNKKMLIYLTKYLLAANRPDLAQTYIKRALLMRGIAGS